MQPPDIWADIFEDNDCFTDDDTCWMCGGLCIITYSELYRGFLGYCYDCDSQWRCS